MEPRLYAHCFAKTLTFWLLCSAPANNISDFCWVMQSRCKQLKLRFLLDISSMKHPRESNVNSPMNF